MAEEKEETQDTHSALEEAWDKAEESAKEPTKKSPKRSRLEAKPEETEEKPAEEVKVEAKPEPGDPLPEEEAKEAGKEPEAEPLDAPHHWAVEHQEMFRKLDPEAQSFLVDRHKDMEGDYTRRTQEIAPLRNATEKWAPYLNQMQADPAQTFDKLMQHEYVLRTGTNEQKAQMLLSLARDYQVDMRPNGNGEPPSAEEDPFGIQEKIQAAVNPVMQQVQQLGNFQQQQQGYSQQTSQAAAQKNIDQFRDSKGADGKPAHPYFSEVFDDMLAMAQAKQALNQTPDIADLYERAIWSNASVRAKMQAAERHESRQTEQQRQARAKVASGSLAGGGGSQTEQPKGRREAIEAAFDASS